MENTTYLWNSGSHGQDVVGVEVQIRVLDADALPQVLVGTQQFGDQNVHGRHDRSQLIFVQCGHFSSGQLQDWPGERRGYVHSKGGEGGRGEEARHEIELPRGGAKDLDAGTCLRISLRVV